MPNQEVDEFFNTLYQKTKDEILMYIIVKCGDTDQILDIFQETFVEIAKLLKKKGIAYFKRPEAMVMTIAKRKIYRRFNLRQKLGIGKIRYKWLERTEEELTDFEDFTVEDITAGTLEQIQGFLGKQDILTRKIFYMRFYMETPPKDIAEIMEIPEKAVKNRLYRSLKSIKDELEKGTDAL